MNFITAPLIADLFLLAILAIGRQEVHDGTIGADDISPIDIMTFFLSLAYIAISIDASGLIRYLAFKVLQWGGDVGHRLFFYLYAFFFALASLIGNDPIILSGTAFLAYMTRVSKNIVHPRAWIHTQFAVANIASAILVSSNPTNLVLAGAFNIKFIHYTANMIVPVVATGIVLFPFLLYIVFANESLIPVSIKTYELPEEAKAKKPVNPNIPHARGNAEEEENNLVNDVQGKLLSLEEIMNPFLDKGGAAFGAAIMAVTLSTLLALNAASQATGKHPVFWVTLPAAFVMLCWDIGFGWYHRHETREIARKGRQEVEYARARRTILEEEESKRVTALQQGGRDLIAVSEPALLKMDSPEAQLRKWKIVGGDDSKSLNSEDEPTVADTAKTPYLSNVRPPTPEIVVSENGDDLTLVPSPLPESSASMPAQKSDRSQIGQPSTSTYNSLTEKEELARIDSVSPPQGLLGAELSGVIDEKTEDLELKKRISHEVALRQARGQPTLVTHIADAYRWLQETFPTPTAVVAHLPFALVPFAFTMFILVQGLVSRGWISVFAYGWDHWVDKTGTVGSVGGMGFLSVILCNVSLTFDPTAEADN
jgi:Na+/H+ antiporter NhaD/arsenite permease-like protein